MGAGPKMVLTGFHKLRVVATTCAISADNVQLPAVRSQQLTAAGQPCGDTPFTINLNNCTDGGGAATTGVNVRTYFDGAAIDAGSGRLKIDTGGIADLQVQLPDNNGGAPGANVWTARPCTDGLRCCAPGSANRPAPEIDQSAVISRLHAADAPIRHTNFHVKILKMR